MAYEKLLRDAVVFHPSTNGGLTCRLDCPEYVELCQKYGLMEQAGTGGSLKRAVSLLHWLCKRARHAGNYENAESQDALTLLNAIFVEKRAVNCLALSITLSECLLAVGIFSRVMFMMPYAEEDVDNHVIVECWDSDRQKWVMRDPTYNSLRLDENGQPMSLYELRGCLGREAPLCLSGDAAYNGSCSLDLEDIRSYYAKNSFFYRCRLCQTFGAHAEFGGMKGIANIAPLELDVRTHMISTIRYRIREFGEFPFFTQWLEMEERSSQPYLSPDALYAPPRA